MFPSEPALLGWQIQRKGRGGASKADSLTQDSNAGHIGAFPSRKVDLSPFTQETKGRQSRRA
jgi:hypothetical protein